MDNQIKILLTAVDQLSGPLGTATRRLDEFGRVSDTMGKTIAGHMAEAKKSLEALSGATISQRQSALAGMQADVEKLTKALTEAKRERDFFLESAKVGGDAGMREFARDIEAARARVTDLAAEISAKQSAIGSLEKTFDGAGNKAERLRERLSAIKTGLADFAQNAEKVGRTLEGLGTRIGGIGLAGQAALSQAELDLGSLTRDAVSTEKALYGIASTAEFTGVKAKAMVGEWTLAINQIAVATNQQQDRVTAAFGAMVARGLDPQIAIKMLTPIGKAATAAQADIEEMSLAMEASFSKLNIDVAGTEKALDIMAMAGKRGAFELKDMAQYFPMLTSTAQGLGITGAKGLAELGAAAQIANSAIADSASAANDLNNWLLKLSAATTYKNFEKFGENLDEIKKRALESGNYIGTMASEIKRITGGDTAKIAALFPDQQAGRFIQRLILDLGEYKKIGEDAFVAVGTSAQDFETQMQSTANVLQSVQIISKAAVTNSGAIKDLLSVLKDVSQWVSENPDTAKYLIFGTAGAVAFGAVASGIGATITSIGLLVKALGSISAFLIANPLVLGILGVSAATSATAYGAFAFGSWAAEQIDIIVQKLNDNKDMTLGTWLFDFQQEGLARRERLTNAISSFVDEVIQFASDSAERWKQAGANLIVAMKQGIADGLKGALGIGQKLTEALAYLKNEGAKWMQVGREIMQGLLNGIQEKYKEIIGKIKGLGTDMLNSIKDVLGIRSPSRQFMLVGEMAGEGLRIGILDKVKTVAEAASKLGGAALYAVKDKLTANWLKDTLGDEAALAKAMAEDRRKLEEEGARVAQRFRTDIEIAMDEMANYDRLLQAGVITWDTYGRAVAEATEGMSTGLAEAAAGVDTVSNKIKKSYRDNKGRFLPADEAERASAEWARAADDINRSLTDALMRAFEGGKGFAEALKNTLINTFKTMVLQPTIRAILAPVSGAMASVFSGGASASGGGTLGTLSNLSSLNSIYNMMSTGFANIGSTVGSYATMLAQGGSMGSTVLAGSQQAAMLNAQGMGGYSVSAMGGTLSTAASYLGGAAVGMFVGNMISGGYSAIGKNGNIATGAGTAIGAAIGGPIGAAIGGALGGVVNRLFGRKLDSAGITGTFGSTGFEGNQYEFYKGGLFSSNKTKYRDMDAEVDAALDNQYLALRASVTGMGATLGLATEHLEGFTYNIGRLNFKGMNEEQINQAIADLFGSVAEAMAGTFDLSSVTRAGETAMEALTRLSGSLVGVNGVLDTLNLTMMDVSLAGADAASGLADAFGGLQNLTQATEAYYQAFYTEQERLAESTQQLTTALGNLGYTLPETKAQFRDMVDALDLTTTGGQQTFAALMQLAPAFAEVADAADAARIAAEQQAEAARQIAEQQYAAWRQGVARLDAQSINAARSVLESAIQAEADRTAAAVADSFDRATRQMQASIDNLSESIGNLRNLADALVSAAMRADLRTPGLTRQSAQADLRAALAGARQGLMPELDALRPALDALSQDASALFANRTDYLIDAARTRADLLALADLADTQATIEERMLAALEAQLAAIEERARQAADQASAQETALLSVADATRALETALLGSIGLEFGDLSSEIIDALDRNNGFATLAEYLASVDRNTAWLLTLNDGIDDLAIGLSSLDSRTVGLLDINGGLDAVVKAISGMDSNLVDKLGSSGALGNVMQALANVDRNTANLLDLNNGIDDIATGLSTLDSRAIGLLNINGGLDAVVNAISGMDANVVNQLGSSGALGKVLQGLAALPPDIVAKYASSNAMATLLKETGRAGFFNALLDFSLRNNLSNLDFTGLSAGESVALINNTIAETVAGIAPYEPTLSSGATSGSTADQQELLEALVQKNVAALDFTGLSAAESVALINSTIAETISDFANNLPTFAVGTNYVPSDMVAQIHKGERIIPAADNTALMDALTSPARRDAVLVEEIRLLRAEIAAMKAGTDSTAKHTAKTARLLDRVMPDGDALSVRTAT